MAVSVADKVHLEQGKACQSAASWSRGLQVRSALTRQADPRRKLSRIRKRSSEGGLLRKEIRRGRERDGEGEIPDW